MHIFGGSFEVIEKALFCFISHHHFNMAYELMILFDRPGSWGFCSNHVKCLTKYQVDA